MTLAVLLQQAGVDFDGHAALDGFDLQVRRGERVALVGPSGAGKTTVLRLCSGAIQPSSGVAEVLGRDLAAVSERELRDVRRSIGTVSQQLHLVGPLRVIHNVNAGRLGSWSNARALRSLARPLELDAAREALVRVGIGNKLFERTDRLSGGEQQRVALARALVDDPELILADEPVSSLDPARANEVMVLLCELADEHRRTLIVSLHDFDLARRHCDRVVGIVAGRVFFDRRAAEVTDELGEQLYRISVS